ncbi:peptidoglycan-binding domain-containing protein [Streptomyces sp. NPDC046942]|uniref:peptidoglycan-binding domain-containing protein n=1 Tax=Streptomyces sp. NPDC046942 TaxID=3155137 RepID=UPI0033C3807C
MTDSKGPRDPEGHTCPECGAPRGPDLSPSCDCTERAAEALRETRTAEAAAAEDFDPLRIRPYVKAEAVETTLPLRPLPGSSTADLRMQHPEGARGTARGTARPATTTPHPDDDPSRPKPRSVRVLLSVAGASVAVVAAAGFASGLFSYDTPSSRDRAAQEVRESVPEVTPSSASPSPTPPDSPAASRSRVRPPTSAPPPPSASPTPSPSPSPTTRPPTPPSSPTPSLTTTPAAHPTPAAAPVLRLGDKGPEVTELQQRLRQLNLYADEINGIFTRPVQDAVRNYQLARGIVSDTYGEYGPATRKSLEAETSTPPS